MLSNLRKRIIFLVPLVSLCACGNTSATNPYDFEYYIYDDEVIITNVLEEKKNSINELVIPSLIEGKPVVKINNYAFNETSISKLTFEEGSKLEEIGQGSFADCLNLSEINFPITLRGIGKDAFNSCAKLSTINFSELSNLELIGSSAFYNNESLVNINFTNGLETIGDEVFYNCKNLEKVTFENSIKIIGANSFCNDSKLRIEFNGLETIPEGFSSLWNATDELSIDNTYEIPFSFK